MVRKKVRITREDAIVMESNINKLLGNNTNPSWEETVMSLEDIIIAICVDCPYDERFSDEDCHHCQRNMETIAKEQAETSYEKGKQDGKLEKEEGEK